MTATTHPHRRLLHDAIRALTAAARLESGPDFAEFVTLAVTAAAANVGGIETALARRPGSWEAAYVRDLLNSSVGDDLSDLLWHRTEPLVITIRPDETLTDLSYWQLFYDDEAELMRRYDALGLPSMTLLADGSMSGDPTPWTDEQEASAAAVTDLLEQVANLQAQDLATYSSSLADAVRATVAAMCPALPVAVEVITVLDWNQDAEPEDDMAWLVSKNARLAAPLPSSGVPFEDYQGADVSRVERDAGRSPLQRIASRGVGGRDSHDRPTPAE